MSDPTNEQLNGYLSMSSAMRASQGPKTKIEKDGVTQELEKPSGRDPNQNAWLTLTLGYSLDFLDRNSLGTAPGGGPVIVQDGGSWWARDSDDFLFPILDWGHDEIIKFNKVFQQGEQIWNHRFFLVTPENFDMLDYTSPSVPGVVLHPNILCLFRLVSGLKTSQTISVVRIDPAVFEDTKYEVRNYKTKATRKAMLGFRSHSGLLTEHDVYTPVLGHELGHMIGEDHIMALKGDQQCKVNPGLTRCYGTTPEELRNIMGGGTEITKFNAKPWTDALKDLVGGPPLHCYIFLLTTPGVDPLPPLRVRPKDKKP